MPLRTRKLTSAIARHVALVFVLVLGMAVDVSAAIATNTVTSNGASNGGSTNTVSWSFNAVGEGCANCALLVQVEGSNVVDDVTGATYNGVAMTLIDKGTVGFRYTYVFGLQNPASGSNTVQVTASSTHLLIGVAISYSGVGGFGASSVTTGASPLTGNLTTTQANSWVYAGVLSEFVPGWSGVTNATFRVQSSVTAAVAIFDNNAAVVSPGSYSMTISNGGATSFVMIMVELFAAGGGGGGTSSGGLLLLGVGGDE